VNAGTEAGRFEAFEAEVRELGRKAPPVRISDEERVRRAKRVMIERLDSRSAMDLETCVHCGMCAEACHFYESTQDPKYTPVHKVYLLRKVYRREISPVRWLNRLVMRDITAKDLEQWQELLFNSCTECGRCDLMCPMGIHLTKGIRVARQALAAAGYMPPELRAIEHEQSEQNTLFGVGGEKLREAVEELNANGANIPIDKDTADVLLLSTVSDILLYRDSLAATAKILNRLGVDWTIRSDGFEASNFGFLSGDDDGQIKETRRIVDVARAVGAKLVIVPECGHAYPALRFEAPNKLGEEIPFEVMAISEYIGREVTAGRLKLKKSANGKRITYHDPCKLGRHGGIFQEPRAAIAALGYDFREMESHGKTQYCCGGGGGVYLLSASDTLRRRTFDIKARQVDDSGADSVVTSCDSCRMTLVSGAKRINWDKSVESLVELVAANLAD
jgi:Fe-S oxidoreductase